MPGTFTRKSTDLGIGYAQYPTGCAAGTAVPCQVPPGSEVLSNGSIAKNAINPATYQGIRASALWDISDDWNALVTQSYQTIDAQGVFYQMPNGSDGEPLPKQSVTLFNNSFNKDKFENTAFTVNGKIGDLKVVYTGAYLIRNVSQVQDYTNYSRGVYADYYQCHGAEPANGLAAKCYSPSTTWNETERNTHQSHEFRLSTPDDWRVRGIVGDGGLPDATGTAQYCSPSSFTSDVLTNNELGWKTEFFDPGVLGNVGFGTNGPDYRIRGVETSLIAVVAPGLTAQGGASWNSSTQTNSPYLIANNPALLANPATKAEFGQPILSVNNPSLSAGPNVSTTQLRFENPAYSQYDASMGVAKDAWTMELYAQNLTDKIASVFTSTTQFVPAETITRPRVLGVKFGYKF